MSSKDDADEKMEQTDEDLRKMFTELSIESESEEDEDTDSDPYMTPEDYLLAFGHEMSLEDRILYALDGDYSQFHLNDQTREELRRLIRLLDNRRSGRLAAPVQYGLLLQCDIDGYGATFLTVLSNLLGENGLLNNKPELTRSVPELDEKQKTETEFPASEPYNPIPAYGFRIVQLPDWSFDIIQWRTATKQTLKREMEFLKEHPDIVGGLVVSRKGVDFLQKHNKHLLSQVYGHHLYLDDWSARDIFEKVCRDLSETNIEMDGPFREKLEEYVRIVYPKAERKLFDFTSDLVNDILAAYYTGARLEGKLTDRCIPSYQKPRSYDEIIKKLRGMVGMDSIEEQFRELYEDGQYRKRRENKKTKTPLRLHMVFKGNPGTGKTTVARMTADLLYEMGLIKTNKLVSATHTDLVSEYIGETSIKTRAVCESAYGGVLFIDEAYTLTSSKENAEIEHSSKHEAECVAELLTQMENNTDRLVVIFAGYGEPMERFLKSNPGLESRIGRTIEFRDYTEDELMQIFRNLCADEGFQVAEDAAAALKGRIAFEKSGEHFANARSVENIFNEVKRKWLMEKTGESVFTRGQIESTMPERHPSNIRDMIGMNEINEKLEAFRKRVTYVKEANEKGARVPPMNLHMVFTGNPGTGKTTVAQAIAEDFYKHEILKTNKLIVLEARDLLSDWSRAGKKMEEAVQRAMGGVLFIDEAYALTEYASGNVGREVVASLITSMEKYRGELSIIMAGYPDNMQAFLNVNPGMASRIGCTIHFEDYKVPELTDIFFSKMKNYGFKFTEEDLQQPVTKIMEFFHVVPNFGNGRFVDKLIDQTVNLRSMRGEPGLEITAEDIPDRQTILKSLPNRDYIWDPDSDEPEVQREQRKRTAVHEVGHALVSYLLRPKTVLQTISISEQAFSSGRVGWQKSSADDTEEQLKCVICVFLGGRDAEKVVYGTHSAGCGGDYEKAKSITRAMLERYAMGPELGSSDITPLLREADERTMALLTENKDLLLKLSNQLVEKKSLTLTFEELKQTVDEFRSARES